MTEPTFDKDGYPTEATLQDIRMWDFRYPRELFEFISEAWNHADYGRIHWPWVHLSTGGWSGNEDLIGALQENYVVWASCFWSERRGGHYVFRLPKGARR